MTIEQLLAVSAKRDLAVKKVAESKKGREFYERQEARRAQDVIAAEAELQAAKQEFAKSQMAPGTGIQKKTA